MTGPRPFNEFKELSPETLAVIEAQGFSRATPVQDATIPLFCGNKDVAVDACTGSGKTLAFIIPIVEKLRKLEEPLKKHQVGAVVVSPTRELAKQIYNVAEPFIASVPGLTTCLLVGGTDPAEDVAKFKEAGGHVLIGSPGRIDDVMRRCSVMDTRSVEVLVLDEADRLLAMGFRAQLDAIMARLPKQRRTGLFSATQTEAVEQLTRAGLRNPVRINVAVNTAPGHASRAAEAGQKTPQGLQIQYLTCESHEKLPHLLSFLSTHASEKVIIYFLTCMCVDYYTLALTRLRKRVGELPLLSLHGHMKQKAREATLAKFSSLPAGVLLCTDLAARGLDIPDISWIIQFDPPQDPDQFVHRVGRTARMGRSGNALVYLLPNEGAYVELLRLRKVPLQELEAGQEGGDVGGVASAVRKEAETDREVMEKATKAFVSYVRAYKEHHLKYIFRLPDLDMGHLATAFGLLRLPKLPDVKKMKGVEHFTPSNVEPDTVAFKDKAREKQRQKLLKQKQQQHQEALQQRRGSQQHASSSSSGREAGKGEANAVVARLPAAKRRQLQQREERGELDHDYKLWKKLKRGKISEREFDVGAGLSSDEELAAVVEEKLKGRMEGGGPQGSDSDGDSSDHEVAGVVTGTVSKQKAGNATGKKWVVPLAQKVEEDKARRKAKRAKKKRKKAGAGSGSVGR